MDRTHYTNHRSDSPDRSMYNSPQNLPFPDFSDRSSLLQALQNNPNLQDPQCLNKILIPMLLVQLLQNQQTCQHQAPYPEQHRSRRLRSFHDARTGPCYEDRQPSYDAAEPPVQEVYSVPSGRYRSNEYVLDQCPPSIQYSDEDIRHACCVSSPDYSDKMRRRNLIPSRSHNYNQQQVASARPPSPEQRIVERCYWCRQQLYRYYDPDLCQRVFTHFPCHRGAILAPAGKSSLGSIRQMSLVDTSPFNQERDVMLPCPYLCATTETTYNSSFRHPEVVARESVCRLVSKKLQPWEQRSNALIGQSSLESIGNWDKPELPIRLREERVMFLKPNCCPSRARSRQMTNSSVDVDGYNYRYRTPGRCVTLANSLDSGYNSRNRRPAPCVSFSPSTEAYQRHRSMEKKKKQENVLYYNCRPPQENEDGGYDFHCKPEPHHPPPGSRSTIEKEKLQYYKCRPPQKNEDGGYELYCKPDPQHRRRGSGRISGSSSASSPSRGRRSRHSHGGSASAQRRHSRRSHGNASARRRRRRSDPSHRHNTPRKSRSRGSWCKQRRAKSELAMMSNYQQGQRHRSQSSMQRHPSRSIRHRGRHSRPRYSISDPTLANQDHCEEVVVCCPSPHNKSVYNASYGNPAEHPYYVGPSAPNFRRQRFEMN